MALSLPFGDTFKKNHWVQLPELPPACTLTIQNEGRVVTIEPAQPQPRDFVVRQVTRPIFWGYCLTEVEEWVLPPERVKVILENETPQSFDLYIWSEGTPPENIEPTYFVDENETTTLNWPRDKLRQIQLVRL